MPQTEPLKETPPPQHQKKQPGLQSPMEPEPMDVMPEYRASGKLEGKVALITGGDSGIGRSVALLYAKEGADVAIVYLDEHEDATRTKELIQAEGRRCLTIAGDVGDPEFCKSSVESVIEEFDRLDILVNNAAEQHVQQRFEDITPEQLERTFRTNIFGYFYMAQAALRHMGEGSTIINSASVTAYHGNQALIDYSATKGAIVSFTRSLSESIAGERKIRVNAVAPGPVWTPLIPASFSKEHVGEFGASTYLKRPAEPAEIAPNYVFLASSDSVFMTGEVLHPNGGEMITS